MALTVTGKCVLWVHNWETASIQYNKDIGIITLNMEDGVQINIDGKLVPYMMKAMSRELFNE